MTMKQLILLIAVCGTFSAVTSCCGIFGSPHEHKLVSPPENHK